MTTNPLVLAFQKACNWVAADLRSHSESIQAVEIKEQGARMVLVIAAGTRMSDAMVEALERVGAVLAERDLSCTTWRRAGA